MDPYLKDIVTIGFSSASLLLSIVSLAMTISSYRRTGSLLQLHLNYERHSESGSFVLKVQNKGYHSIKIVEIRMATADRTIPVATEAFSLEYGEEKTIPIPLSAYPVHPLEIQTVEAVDIARKVHPVGTGHLKQKIIR